MSGKIAVITCALAMVTVTTASLDSAQARSQLPGLKSYNFTMSPQKLRRYCDRIWLGRFWWKNKRYGCDDIPGGEGRKRVDTHEYDIDCHGQRCIVRIIPRLGAGGGDGREPSSAGHDQRP